MVITKEDVMKTVDKLHKCGKSCPNEYVRINKCRTQEEINATYTAMVAQLTESIWDWFSHNVLPSKEVWERATYKAMGLRGEITAELMINAIKEVRSEMLSERLGPEKTPEEKRAEKSVDFSPMSSEDKLCNAMLWTFTRIWRKRGLAFGDFKISPNAVECEMDRLGIPISKGGLKYTVIEAGLKERKYNESKNITEELEYNGVIRRVPKRVISVCKGTPVIWGFMPKDFVESLDDDARGEIWLKLL